MSKLDKYRGIIPAFYACYDEEGNVSGERVQALTRHFIEKGVKGVYVNGSSGECIYQSVEERKLIIENVMAAAKGKLTVINHVACNNTKDSVELAKHSESVGVDAIASIPPIYFRLPEYSIAAYWNAISAKHRFRDLQYTAACWHSSDYEPVCRDDEKPKSYRCKELFHACPGYSDVQNSRSCGKRRLCSVQRPG